MVINYRHIAVFLALVLGTAGGSAAGEPERLDLLGAMRMAREGAGEVAAAELRVSAAAARERRARAERMPTLRLSETWVYTDSPADVFGWQLNQERFSFPAFVSSDPNDPDFLDGALTRLEAELPLYTGGEISTRREQARLGVTAATEDQAAAGDRAALQAAEAFVRLTQARENVALLTKARETLAAHVELARVYAGQGMLVRSELLRAEVELARLDDLLAEARGQARVAEKGLSFRLGRPLDSAWELAALPAVPELAEELAAWQASAAGRPDVAAARARLAAGRLEAEARKAGGLPRVGLLARQDFVDDWPLGTHGDSTTLLAMASWNFWDGGRRRAEVAAATAEADAGAREVELFEQGVRLEVAMAFEAAQVAAERRGTALQAVAAASEAVRITEERFRAGVAKTLDVLDAATARRETETRELVARTEAHLAALRLALAAGRAPESMLKPQPEGGKP